MKTRSFLPALVFCIVLPWLSIQAAPPNVVLLSVDTLRADHLGCYGHKYDTSPNIDAFAKNALVFEDCVCEVPLTNPSFGAMMSSLYPRMTGTTRNGLRMPASVPLLAERFHAAGYYTACVQSNWTLKKKLSGLARGFDVYDDDFHEKRWGFMKAERYAEDVTSIALKLLRDRDAAKPFFFWVHYSDPHAPYEYHRDFNPTGEKLWCLQGKERIPVKYDSEIAFMDSYIGRLLEALPKENTVILFTADHGESLYEHDYLGHGRRIYQDNLHVPLIVQAPGVTPGRTPMPTCVLDIAPTLLAFAGIDPVPGMLGKNLLQGNGPNSAIPLSRTRFFETYGGAVPKFPGAKAIMGDRKPMRQGMCHEGWKFIVGGEKPELYFLPEDRGELKNLAAQKQDIVADFRKRLVLWNKEHLRGESEPAELSEDDIQALESLGYLE